MSYQNDGAANSSDNFDFTVDDGEGTASTGTSSIIIRPYPGDYNQDLVVDAADYVLWRNDARATGVPAFSGADGDGNGSIDQDDYGLWRQFWENVAAARSRKRG